MILLPILQSLFLVVALTALWINRRSEGPYHALQASIFGWMLAISELARLALGWLGDPAITGVFAIVGVLVLPLGMLIHLTQFERSRNDEGAEPLASGPNWIIAGAYLLGAVSWLATLLMAPRPAAGILGAMSALAVVVASVVIILAALTLGLTRGRPGPWAAGGGAGGGAVALLAAVLGMLVAG